MGVRPAGLRAALLARNRELERLPDDCLQLGELLAHGSEVGAERAQPSADEIDEHLEILDARHALGQQVALDAVDRSGELSALVENRVEAASEAALVLAERTGHSCLDARRQDRGELARRATQLVDVALGASEQRAEIGTRGLGGAEIPLSHLADAAQGRLARVPQWIVLTVLGVHVAPLTAPSVEHRPHAAGSARRRRTTVGRMDSWHEVRSSDDRLLFDRIRFARGLATRTRGLLGRRALPEGEGLAFREKSIHMFFMRMSLDIVFCDARLEIVRVVRDLPPWRMAGCRRARYVLEVGPGEAARLGLHEGMVLRVDPPF
jgi:uncharacterized membrane protein (UPF0127 family)